MFTGIIRATGRVVGVEQVAAGRRLVVVPEDGSGWVAGPQPGDSVCVSGCCLTVAGPVGPGGELAFDVIPETLTRTTLGGLEVGDRVHLEPSVTASTPLDGHVVQGHVEGVGQVVEASAGEDGGEFRLRIEPPAGLMPCMVPKGSVAVDGVSLTIAAVGPGASGPHAGGGWFEVALIPTTLDLTTLGGLAAGSTVNLETDVLVRTVVHVLRHFGVGPGTEGSGPGGALGAGDGGGGG